MCCQRLLELKLYDSAFNGVGLSAAIIDAATDFALPLKNLEAIICDGASVNRVACEEIRKCAKDFTHISCVSHGLDNIGRNVVRLGVRGRSKEGEEQGEKGERNPHHKLPQTIQS